LSSANAAVPLARLLVHVESAVRFDLQAVALRFGSENARTSSTPLYGSLIFTSYPIERRIPATRSVNCASHGRAIAIARARSPGGACPGPSSETRPLTAGIEWQLMCHTGAEMPYAWSSASLTAF
jgi:hypothetical protein